MTVVSGEIRWGATVDTVSGEPRRPRDWVVELETEPLSSVVVESTLPRFLHHATHLAPDAKPACSLALGRFRMTLRVNAPDPHEAADSGESIFARALETALWPRSSFAKLAQYTVTVKPSDEYAFAAA